MTSVFWRPLGRCYAHRGRKRSAEKLSLRRSDLSCDFSSQLLAELPFLGCTVFPHLCSKLLPGYPTTRPGNFITRLLPGHLLPGPGIAKPNPNAFRFSECLVSEDCPSEAYCDQEVFKCKDACQGAGLFASLLSLTCFLFQNRESTLQTETYARRQLSCDPDQQIFGDYSPLTFILLYRIAST